MTPSELFSTFLAFEWDLVAMVIESMALRADLPSLESKFTADESVAHFLELHNFRSRN